MGGIARCVAHPARHIAGSAGSRLIQRSARDEFLDRGGARFE